MTEEQYLTAWRDQIDNGGTPDTHDGALITDVPNKEPPTQTEQAAPARESPEAVTESTIPASTEPSPGAPLFTLYPPMPELVLTPRCIAEWVVQSVSLVFDVSLEDIVSHTHKRPVVEARQTCIYLARKLAGLNLSEIARFMQIDHTTVMHGGNVIVKKREENPVLAERITTIEEVYNRGLGYVT